MIRTSPFDLELLVDSAMSALKVEMSSAYSKFGLLTQDRFKANTILSEENGEVARAILELQRAERMSNVSVATVKAEELKSELLQVASVALFFYINMLLEETKDGHASVNSSRRTVWK